MRRAAVAVAVLLACAAFAAHAAPIMMQEEAEAKAEVAAPLADSAEEGVKEDAPVEGAGNANAAAAKAAGEGEEGDDEDEGEYDDEDYGDEDADYDDYDEDEDEEDEAGEGAKAKRQESFHEEYERYLAESLEELMDDPSLADEIIEEMSNLPPQKQSKAASRLLTVAKHLQKSNIRTQADEQERAVLERQRRQIRRVQEHDLGRNRQAGDADFGDKDADLFLHPEENLERLQEIATKRVKLMGTISKNKRKAYVEREMQREINFRNEVAKLPPAEREQRIELHKRQLSMLRAAHGNAPGHEAQLKEVWDEQDGLREMPFDPRVFFRLHDTTGDNYLDLKELEALFYREAKELHTGDDGEIDDVAMREEMARMRETVMSEADTDKDGLLSEMEFLQLTKRPDFHDNDTWDPLFPDFTDEEIEAFRKVHKDKVHLNKAVLKVGEKREKDLIEALRQRVAQEAGAKEAAGAEEPKLARINEEHMKKFMDVRHREAVLKGLEAMKRKEGSNII